MCFLISRAAASPGVVQRVSLNPRKCQEPHLLRHLKWEYFAPFFFFFKILIWSFGVCVAAFSPDANNKEHELSDKGEICENDVKEGGNGKWN